MDGTITESRSVIMPMMKKLITDHINDIVIISGSTNKQMRHQLKTEFNMLPLSGNQCEYWQNKLNKKEKQEILNFLKNYPQGEDLIQDRLCQISYSLIGHNKPLEEKRACDPDKKKRKEIISKFKSKSIEASIGGTTCIDFYKKGFSKGDNILRYIKKVGWKKKDCIYIGDSLFEGGNDYSVVGKIPTISTSGPLETFKIINDKFRTS